MPLPLFLGYADWFRERFVPESDPSDVAAVEREASGFRVTTAAGSEARVRRLVLAVGVMPFPRVPEPLRGVDDPRIAYAVDPSAFGGLADKRVVVLGGGQNGLESAAMAHRNGAASVEIVVRSQVRWFTPREHWEQRSPLKERLYRVAYPIIGFGPPPINRFVLHPDLFSTLPVRTREKLTRRLLRPGGSPWIREQVEGRVQITEGRSLASVDVAPDAVRLRLDDGSEREADAVVVCVGYRFDLDRLTWLHPAVRAGIAVRDGWPVLDRAFRSTDPAIQFVGLRGRAPLRAPLALRRGHDLRGHPRCVRALTIPIGSGEETGTKATGSGPKPPRRNLGLPSGEQFYGIVTSATRNSLIFAPRTACLQEFRAGFSLASNR